MAVAEAGTGEALGEGRPESGVVESARHRPAADLWQALVSSRGSIVETVETVERDGKRFLLARANPLGSPELTSLTRDESDIVWLAAFGHTYKFVAYEPGFTVSNLVRRLPPAMLKLGVASRHDLLRKPGRQAFYTVRFSAIDPP